MTPADLLPLAATALVTGMAAATDLRDFKVYNALTYPALLAGLAASAALGGWAGLGASVLGAGVGLLVLFVPFALGGVGAGDVKLLTAVGAWLGPQLTYQVFLASALCAGGYAFLLILLRGGLLAATVELDLARAALADPRSWRRPEAALVAEARRPDRRRRLVPFAAMTCLGFALTLAWWGADLKAVWPPYGRPAAPDVALAWQDSPTAEVPR